MMRCLSILCLLFIFKAEVSEAQSSSWVRCASEHQHCNFSGTTRVLYGESTASRNVIRSRSNGVSCSNGIFGDPAPGIVKACWYEVVSSPSPSPTEPTPGDTAWIRCASENQTCSFSGTREVRYGTETQNVIRTIASSTNCSNSVFGDPVPGTLKSCWYASATPAPEPEPEPVPEPTPAPGGSWVSCASENQTCSFSGTREVRYGTETQNVIRTITSSTQCSNSIFGDPVPGTVKRCWYSSQEVAGSPQPEPIPEEPAPEEPIPPVVTPSPGGGGSGTGGSIVARLSATRISGPAPLAVQFDAIASTSTSVSLPFHDLLYDFNFGDERGQSWEVTGLPKNTQNGAPLAAHVYDNPGTYTAQVRVHNPLNNEQAYAYVTVTVQDPNAVYSGSNTVCVSSSANYSGCPQGALTQTNLPSSYRNKRILLRRGESFPGISIPPTDDNVLIATYGSGNKPVVNQVYLGNRGDLAQWPDEVTVMDLNIRNGFSLAASGSRVLLYRCDMTEPNADKVDIGTALGYYATHGSVPLSSYYWPREIFLVENRIIGDTNGDQLPGIVVMGTFAKSALLGNHLNRATEHTVRMWSGFKTVLAHNFMGGEHYAPNPPGIRAALKVHSGGTSAYQDNVGASGFNIATRYMVTADNRFGSTLYMGSWMVGFAPQNADQGTVEGLEDIIMERDVFQRGPYSSQDIHNVARRSTVRGASAVGGAPLRMHQVLPSQWSGDPGLLPWIGPYFGQPSSY